MGLPKVHPSAHPSVWANPPKGVNRKRKEKEFGPTEGNCGDTLRYTPGPKRQGYFCKWPISQAMVEIIPRAQSAVHTDVFGSRAFGEPPTIRSGNLGSASVRVREGGTSHFHEKLSGRECLCKISVPSTLNY